MTRYEAFVKSRFDTFQSIEDEVLKAYNQFNMALNIAKDFGKEYLEAYLSQFKGDEKKNFNTIASWVKLEGLENVKKEITKRIEIV